MLLSLCLMLVIFLSFFNPLFMMVSFIGMMGCVLLFVMNYTELHLIQYFILMVYLSGFIVLLAYYLFLLGKFSITNSVGLLFMVTITASLYTLIMWYNLVNPIFMNEMSFVIIMNNMNLVLVVLVLLIVLLVMIMAAHFLFYTKGGMRNK